MQTGLLPGEAMFRGRREIDRHTKINDQTAMEKKNQSHFFG